MPGRFFGQRRREGGRSPDMGVLIPKPIDCLESGAVNQNSGELHVAAAIIGQRPSVAYAGRFNFANDDCVVSCGISVDHPTLKGRQGAVNNRRSLSGLTIGWAVESVLILRSEPS